MEKKKSSGNSFVKRFIPQKGDSKGELIRKIVIMVAAVVVIVCAVLIINELVHNSQDQQLNDDIAAHWGTTTQTEEPVATTTPSVTDPEVTTTPEPNQEILDMRDYLDNDDLVGRIIIGDIIDYPVFQTTNNSFYLDHNANKEPSVSGAIFADSYTPVGYKNNVGNHILYGHNLMAGTYFAKLTYYYPNRPETDGIEYYKQHPTLQFDTLYEKSTYKIFAGCFMNTDSKDGLVYPYHWVHYFDNEYEFMEFTGNILDRSSFYTDVDLEYGDEILTLSTCYYYPLGKDHPCRFVLFARKLREGESAEVDVSKAYINENPLMFKAYYNAIGGKWEGRTWDTSLVKNFDKYDIDSTKDCAPRLLADTDESRIVAGNATTTTTEPTPEAPSMAE